MPVRRDPLSPDRPAWPRLLLPLHRMPPPIGQRLRPLRHRAAGRGDGDARGAEGMVPPDPERRIAGLRLLPRLRVAPVAPGGGLHLGQGRRAGRRTGTDRAYLDGEQAALGRDSRGGGVLRGGTGIILYNMLINLIFSLKYIASSSASRGSSFIWTIE